MRYVVALLLFFGPSLVAAMLLVRAWWVRSGARLSTLDGSARLLAAVLAGLLWLGLTPPRALMTSRPAQWLGIGLGSRVRARLGLTLDSPAGKGLRLRAER